MLAAILNPPDRAADMPRHERDQEIFGVEIATHAEPAADVILDHADGCFRNLKYRCEKTAIAERRLGAPERGEALPVCVPLCQQAARLHRHGGMTMDFEAFPPHVGGGLE